MPALPSMTRRDALRLGAGAVAVVTLAACTTATNGNPDPATAPGGPEDPDRALRAEVGRAETTLIALYATYGPGIAAPLGTRVTALGSRHAAYRQAIDPDHLADAPGSGTASGSTASRSASPAVTPVRPASTPAAVRATLARLLTAEVETAKARAAQCARATDADLARTIVLAGAGAAAAAEVLRSVTP